MSAYIKPNHLAFLEEAKRIFQENALRETYMNEEETLIALRHGADRDCIEIYGLDERVAFFSQQIDPTPLPRKVVKEFSSDMEIQLRANDHKQGWGMTSYEFLAQRISYNFSHLYEELAKEDRNKHEITKRCANIANFAMMIADNEGEHL